MRRISKAHEEPKYFATLTYGDTYPSPAMAKGHLKRFCQAVERQYENAGKSVVILWRMEFQKRGAPHFHILLWETAKSLEAKDIEGWARYHASLLGRFNAKRKWSTSRNSQAYVDWRTMLAFLSVTWAAILDRDGWFAAAHKEEKSHAVENCVDLKAIDNSRKLTAYVSKYVAKTADDTVSQDGQLKVGRWWGMRGHVSTLSFEPLVEVEIETGISWDDLGAFLGAAIDHEYVWSAFEQGRLNFYAFVRRDETEQLALDFGEYGKELRLTRWKDRYTME